MKKLLLLLSFLLLTSCASLDFKVKTISTIGTYDGIYYNTQQVTPHVPYNFYFFRTPLVNDFWWNYSLNNPYGFGLTYNWRYSRWNSNQWYIPYQPQYRFYNYPQYRSTITTTRDRRSNSNVVIPQRTQIRVPNQQTRRRSSSNINSRETQRATPIRRTTQRRSSSRNQTSRRTTSSVIRNKRN